jgi:hypothetical protein
MNPETFAEWLRLQGKKVIHTDSSYWYEASSLVYQAFPYHWVIQPSEDELSGFLRQNQVIGLRYSTPVAAPVGLISYHVVFDGPSYTLDGLDRRSRQNIRKGLKNCRVEPISFERLAEDGWLLEKDTQDRQGRRVNQSEGAWRKRCLAAVDLPGFEAWGALVDGRLVASLLTFQMDDCCEMISQQCHRDYLRARVNNALSFVVTEEMVNRPGTRSIFYTMQSLDAPVSVDQFKFRMGYTAKPIRQRVVFHPWLPSVSNSVGQTVIKQLIRLQPSNPNLPKIQGFLRFNKEGKRPLDEQEWPDCLASHKEEMFQ